jgi:hypothetical protein
VLREPEVSQVGPLRATGCPGVEEDVPRLHVAVHQPLGVRGVERVRHLPDDRKRAPHRQRAVPAQRLAEVAGHVPHGDEERAVRLACVVDRDDGRMVQRGGEPRLAHEPLPEGFVVRELRREDLEGHADAEPRVLGPVDDAHATAAQERLDAVTGELGSDPRNH